MISNFQYFSEEGISLKVNLGINVYTFEGNEQPDISAYYKSTSTGIKWLYNGKEIVIGLPNEHLQGYPTPDLNKVVIVYPPENSEHAAPDNAVIYNADGTVFMQLKAPALVSDLAKQRARFMTYNSPFKLFFDTASWEKDSQGKTVMAMRLGFDHDWLEKRVLDYETGQLGECLTSGRK
jgi:hypothetical protein